MIQANELRIGNWVTTFESDTPIQLCPRLFAYHVCRFNAQDLNPIPLTPEILGRAGFVSNPYQDRYELGDIHVQYCGYRNMCWIENAPHIEYLHHLQNYVYWKSGKELNIEL